MRMAHSRLTACLLGASALAPGLGRPASAQQVQTAAAPVGGASNQPATPLREIVVIAQKRGENVNGVPISVAAATGQDLVKRGITDPAHLEKLTPGFSYEKASYGTPVFTLRGVELYDTAQGATPAVAVSVDQIPLPFNPVAIAALTGSPSHPTIRALRTGTRTVAFAAPHPLVQAQSA